MYMFSSYIRELTWSPGHSFILRYILFRITSGPGIICGPIGGSFPVRGSFAGRDNLRACTNDAIFVRTGTSDWLSTA